ncbi:GMC oxidoreductase [Laetiporus sulphureus 93-53]|uniref:GMC oxidoreductase n=1 Tax=Laetiporus sulphureus 93-53 TaxID=1314785 RepID=A0A165DWH1_9APHY|nr:GMC oxidoreductase [Laetiporus sulphureus 93-53]KZT05773.1 GMC oxidoreductase [Laetiporus sulphureus 93-53]
MTATCRPRPTAFAAFSCQNIANRTGSRLQLAYFGLGSTPPYKRWTHFMRVNFRKSARMEQKLATLSDVANNGFDFVIVGGGTAGLVLANRLTENPEVSVAVLEAGKAHIEDPLIQKLDGWVKQLANPEYDWCFPIVPQKHAGNNSISWSRGKGLGGSSAINLLGWTRPQREDFDAIEKLGNPGWNFDRFYEYSKKSEKFVIPETARCHKGYRDLYEFHSMGKDGPIPLSFARTSSGAEFEFQKSLEHHGVTTISDMLSGDLLGTAKIVSSIDPASGTRAYSASQYLFPVLEERPNLKVLSEAYVTRLLLTKDGEEIVASAVEFEHGGSLHQVHASKEVILSAGAIKSPNILELSGIGDREILEPLGIPVIQHLPAVGTNVQEHLTITGLVFEMRDDIDIATSDLMRDPAFQSKLKGAYPHVEGPLSLVWTGITYLPVQTVSERADSIIDMQTAQIVKEADQYPPGLGEQYEMQLELMKDAKVPDVEYLVFPFSLVPDTSGKPRLSLLPVVSHPFSRGTIHINSADPKTHPTIDPHYYEEEADLEIMLDSFKYARKIAQTEPFKNIVVAEVMPGSNVTDDDELRDHLRKHFWTAWHTVGSLSMLPKEKGGVVDPMLKVYGTKNVRVVDLSIIPLEVSAHTQAVAYGIAEIAADIIKNDNRL